jgi:ParD-like antitoxin of type II ParDE toxin-antitoxin system
MAMPVRKSSDPISVRFGQEDTTLAKTLRARAQAHRRSLSDQLKHSAHLGLIAEDNPDIPMSMIKGILEARAELEAGLAEPYQWGVLESDG